MKALTVRQPWAWAIVHGRKRVENRTRNIAGSYRGPLAIHAGLTEDTAAYDEDLIREALGYCDDSWVLQEQLETGAFVGVVDLASVHHASDHGPPQCSPWAEADTWHLMVNESRPLPRPITARGQLGLWTPEQAQVDAMLEQLEEATA